jgi:hypothetical protein
LSSSSSIPTSSLMAAAWLTSPEAAGPEVLKAAIHQAHAMAHASGGLGLFFAGGHSPPAEEAAATTGQEPAGPGGGGAMVDSDASATAAAVTAEAAGVSGNLSSSSGGGGGGSEDGLGMYGDMADEFIAKHGARKALTLAFSLLGRSVPASAVASSSSCYRSGASSIV